jgi:hypothetical protein
MSKKEQQTEMFDGLDAGTVAQTESAETTAAKKKDQTPEEKEMLTQGVKLMREIGVTKEMSNVLELVAEWNTDKENLAPFKALVIEAFGSSENLKDYIDTKFKEEVLAWQGIAKAIPVLNNIKAFYARRENTGTRKVKTVQISIGGVTYNVDANYRDEISALPVDERKSLLLAHPATTKADVIEELF